MAEYVTRKHGWAIGRYITAAILIEGALLAIPEVAAVTIVAAVVGWLSRQRFPRLPFGIGGGIPRLVAGLAMSAVVVWALSAVWASIRWLLIVAVFTAAVWAYLEWAATTISLSGERLLIRRGIITTRETPIPRRQLTSVDWVRSPLGKLLGYGHLDLETAGQVEFVDVIRFVPPRLYVLSQHPDLIGVEA